VHRTRLRVGEGLVGDIAAHARPLALADAQSHPNFAYRPETGEEIYHSLMGVPILRGGRVLGVLAVQNRTFREYDEEEIETLETVGDGARRAGRRRRAARTEHAAHRERGAAAERLEGLKLNEGWRSAGRCCTPARVTIRQMVADDPVSERARLRRRTRADAQRDRRPAGAGRSPAPAREPRDPRDLPDVRADRGWTARIGEAIASGLTAEAAVQRVQDDTRVRMSQVSDPYLRERLADLEDLGNRLLRHLTGDRTAAQEGGLPDDAVDRVARQMGPAELLDYERARVRAIVLEEARRASHRRDRRARALGIPMVGRIKDLLTRTRAGRIADRRRRPRHRGAAPGDGRARGVRSQAMRMREERLGRVGRAARRAGAHPRRRRRGAADQRRAADRPRAARSHPARRASGSIRTEIPFLVRSDAARTSPRRPRSTARPDARAGGRPIVFRTLDVGGDKRLPYLEFSARREPGDGLARDPHRARPAAAAAPAAARAAGRLGGGARARRDVPDGRRRSPSSRRRARCSISRSRARAAARRSAAGGDPRRHDARGAARSRGRSRRCCRASTSCRSAPTT
jgi:phosphotransferase system enzyme I (PtsP)